MGLKETEKEYLARLLSNKEYYQFFLDKHECGPLDGGCYAMARALQRVMGGDLHSVWGVSDDSHIEAVCSGSMQAQHLVLKVGEEFWDADGRHTEEDLLSFWKATERVGRVELRAFCKTDCPESSRDESLISQVAAYISEKMTNPTPMPWMDVISLVDSFPETDVTPGEAIKQLLEHESWSGMSPEEINNGNCDTFVEDLIEIAGGEVWETDLDCPEEYPTHLFLKWGGRFYDAQNPGGLDEWRELQIYKQALESEEPDEDETISPR
jgi:hypothetical protein